MRSNSHLAVGSPTLRMAALLVATLMLALALAAVGAGVQRLLAADATIVVAQDGSGDHTTVAAGVAAAADGDEVLIRPGTYAESVLVDKDITLRGDGDPTEVILQVPMDGPRVEWPGFQLTHALHITDADTVVRDMTIRTPNASTSGIVVHGGAPIITGMIVDVGGSRQQSARGFVYAGSGATPVIEDSITDGFIWIDEGADATIRRISLLDGGNDELGVRVDGDGSRAIVSESELNMAAVWDGASAEFADVRFRGDASCILELRDAGPVLVADSVFVGGTTSICADAVSGLEVRDNSMSEASIVAMSVSGSDGRIAGNSIGSSGTGIGLIDSVVALEGNRLEGNIVGLTLLGPANPVSFAGNFICDNERDIVVNDGGELPDTTTNEICVLPG